MMMKMSKSRGLKCFPNQLNSFYCVSWCFLVLISFLSNFNLNVCVHAKNLDHDRHGMIGKDGKSCEHVKNYFESINVTINPANDNSGGTCSGHCCDDRTESDLQLKATRNFERLVKHHTRSQRGTWESTANIFRDHVLELLLESEDGTLTLFKNVYRKLSPLSREPIGELYKTIKNHITSKTYEDDLELAVEKFFKHLFPMAYHNTVHTTDISNKDFHNDYKNCLTHIYDEVQPFGDIPKKLSRSLVTSVGAATVFVRALDKGAEFLLNAEDLDSENLTPVCKSALLKMSYCSSCKGHNHNHAKPCYGYCVNVMRGCLTQYVGSLDQDWLSFSEAIERLLILVRSNDGIELVIKGIDRILSDAIMYAMENGPKIEMKVKKACGTPSLTQNEREVLHEHQPQLPKQANKQTPPDTQMLNFLVTLDKTKGFFLQIADSLCEDEEYQHSDRNCWAGDHLGDYTQSIIATNAQKYNPEVPSTSIEYSRDNKLHILIDKLINLRNMVLKPLTTHPAKIDADKMQSDMAEGSGGHYYGENGFPEDEDYGDNGSGSGNGNGNGDKAPTIINVHSSNFTPPAGGHSHRISSSTSLVYVATILTITGMYFRRH